MARRGAPPGNRNRVTHGLRTREMKEMRAMVRVRRAVMKLAAALVKAEAARVDSTLPLREGRQFAQVVSVSERREANFGEGSSANNRAMTPPRIARAIRPSLKGRVRNSGILREHPAR